MLSGFFFFFFFLVPDFAWSAGRFSFHGQSVAFDFNIHVYVKQCYNVGLNINNDVSVLLILFFTFSHVCHGGYCSVRKTVAGHCASVPSRKLPRYGGTLSGSDSGHWDYAPLCLQPASCGLHPWPPELALHQAPVWDSGSGHAGKLALLDFHTLSVLTIMISRSGFCTDMYWVNFLYLIEPAFTYICWCTCIVNL